MEINFDGGQVLSGVIGGPGKGVRVTGQAGIGPINIPLPREFFSDPNYPITIEEFPWFLKYGVGIDIPIDAATGQIDIDEFSASIRCWRMPC